MSQARLTITDPQRRVLHGHPWVFASQVEKVEGSPLPGDVVDVHDRKGPIGQGYFNPASQIRVRLLTRDPR